ncbi:MAG TPA: hypothetical protein V6C78_18030 [Crinalium sp.]|jgi:NAD(P)-dependent dehydrogenase (short-subunit alcohol dehydrogenase family)
MSTEQKVAVITGASQSIGAAIVKTYRDRNYLAIAVSSSSILNGLRSKLKPRRTLHWCKTSAMSC